MTDLTAVVSSVLVTVHSAPAIQKHVHSPDRLDTFLQEAYRINGHISSLLRYLRQIRQPYLSTSNAPSATRHRATNDTDNDVTITRAASIPSHLTDAQRAEIDSQTSTLLHELSSQVSSLTAAENLRSSTETALLERRFGKRGGNKILWRWAAGDDGEDDNDAAGKSDEQVEAEGRANSVKTFREGVLWYLGWRLRGAVEVQRGMVEVRAQREREKEKSVLWKMQTGAPPPPPPPPSSSSSSSYPRRADGGGVGGGQIPRRTPGQVGAAGDAGPVVDMNKDNYEVNASNYYNHQHQHHNNNSNHNPSLEVRPMIHGDNGEEPPSESLPPHLLQLFESENSALLGHYNSTLGKIAQAEKSLLEISSLQSTLLGHLSSQGEMIGQLVMDAAGTGENVRRGNRELKRAGERWGRGLARGVFWCTVCICGFLVGWDLVF